MHRAQRGRRYVSAEERGLSDVGLAKVFRRGRSPVNETKLSTLSFGLSRYVHKVQSCIVSQIDALSGGEYIM